MSHVFKIGVVQKANFCCFGQNRTFYKITMSFIMRCSRQFNGRVVYFKSMNNFVKERTCWINAFIQIITNHSCPFG